MQNNLAQKTIKIKASKSYEVIIGSGLLSQVGKYVKQVINECKIAVITDDTVDKLYGTEVCDSLKASGFKVVKFVFKHGEESKNLKTYGQILEFLAENELTRTDAIVALGGGVTGDMAGFASATYLRGIKYIQIPTTLLAQIDSSVGGKTAIDLESGKNLVGAFCQPELVLVDTNTLESLSKEILTDGMGEVAKYAILDKKVFSLLEKDNYNMQDLIYLCVDYKRRIVEKDEFEKNQRKFLNLGHTPAHGIEKLSGYTIAHGRAVSMGLNIILENSLKHKLVSENEYKKIKQVIFKCVGENECPYSVKEICSASFSDKKRSGDNITLVMVKGVGKISLNKISVDQLWGYLS